MIFDIDVYGMDVTHIVCGYDLRSLCGRTAETDEGQTGRRKTEPRELQHHGNGQIREDNA